MLPAAFRHRIPAVCAAAWLAALPLARAGDAPLPVSTAELCLLLRGGSTGAEVLQDTAGRPLLEPLDAGVERLLRNAGADAAFIATLRRTRSQVSPALAQAEHARQETAARQRTERWEDAQALLLETSRASLEASMAVRAQEARQTLARQLRGKLVVFRDQRIQSYDDTLLPDKKEFAFYFAARTDPACAKFTPLLIRFYQQYAAAHPEFELVFVGKDISIFEWETHLRAGPMPWTALNYPRLSEEKDLTAPGNGTLPRLLVVNGAGGLIADSFVDGQYVGPQRVLDELNRRAEAAGTARATATTARR